MWYSIRDLTSDIHLLIRLHNDNDQQTSEQQEEVKKANPIERGEIGFVSNAHLQRMMFILFYYSSIESIQLTIKSKQGDFQYFYWYSKWISLN